jgi:hypothetical protein
VKKIIAIIVMILVPLVVLPKSDLDVQQTGPEAGLLNKSSCLAAALCVNKIKAIFL